MTIDGEPVPMGFPGCRACPLRRQAQPEVCLACYRAGTGAAGAPCAVCGQRRSPGGACANGWCGRADRAFGAVYAVGGYEGDLRRAIVAYKYRGERWWAGVFARLLAGMLEAHATWFEEFDLVVGMPAYLGPGALRAWDPVGLILAHLARLEAGRWDVAPSAVRKRAETHPMQGRSRWAREREAQGPLRRSLCVVERPRVAGARILVVDDVFTEGSSLQELARALVRAGAAEVAGLVLARSPWGPAPARAVGGAGRAG